MYAREAGRPVEALAAARAYRDPERARRGVSRRGPPARRRQRDRGGLVGEEAIHRLYGMSANRVDQTADPPQLVLGFGNSPSASSATGIAAVADLLDPGLAH